MDPLRETINQALSVSWEEWEVPTKSSHDWPESAISAHKKWNELRDQRQKEIDDCVVRNAENTVYLYDKPVADETKVRVAGPFTVESISPHRAVPLDADGELLENGVNTNNSGGGSPDFATIILEHLRKAGVQQARKADRITFNDDLTPFPGTKYICAEGTYDESNDEGTTIRRAGVFIGPEYGTVARPDLVAAAREASDLGFDILIACAFNYDALSAEMSKLGKIPILKARMNNDLHMADQLKNTGAGNLFVVFGEPEVCIKQSAEGIQVRIKGVDVFHPSTNKVIPSDLDSIAAWFIDTDYNEESFYVRQAYFLGAGEGKKPYDELKKALKAEVDEEAWNSLRSSVSQVFPRPDSGRFAVKVINHLGDEVMKVFKV